jgi:hypothetical protein
MDTTALEGLQQHYGSFHAKLTSPNQTEQRFILQTPEGARLQELDLAEKILKFLLFGQRNLS